MVLSREAIGPTTPAGETLIRPTRLAVGRTECDVFRRRPDVPAFTMGQHFVGVAESGPMKGKRVVGSVSVVCGECDLCQRGLASHCRRRVVMGTPGRDGCFADRFVLPTANLHPVPPGVDDDRAAFAVALAAAVQCVQQLRVEGKPYVTVLGDGRVGMLCAQLMNRLNASVRLVGRHESRAETASKWGIRHRLERDVGRRADQDMVIDCTGTAEGFDLALRLVRPRGKVLVKGPASAVAPAPRPTDLPIVAEKEIEVIGSRCGPVGEALQLLQRGEVDVLSLISKRARLDDAPEAIRQAARGESIAVLLEP